MSLTPEKWIPMNGQILVLDDVLDGDRQIGGIFIPEGASDDNLIKGKVLDVSKFLLESGELQDSEFKRGDIVIYSKHAGAGNVYKRDKEIFRLIRFNEILAKVISEKS